MSEKKRILILIDWFAPGYKAGGPIQSCVNMANALRETYDVFILTTDTDHGEAKPYQGITSNQWIEYKQGIQIYYAKKQTLSFTQIKDQINVVKADYVYLNLLFSPYFAIYPLWLSIRNKITGKVIVCPRGTLYDSALSKSSYKKKPVLFLYKLIGMASRVTFHATNEREAIAIKKYFPGAIPLIADNLPNFEQFPFKTCPKEKGNLKCIFIARIVAIKNLLFILNILETIQANVSLTIVGPTEDKSYWEECSRKIAMLPGNIKVEYIGAKQNNELQNLLQHHHLFVLPTTGENFGHAIFESLLAGRPVLISDQTPWLGLEKIKAGWDLPLSTPAKFAAAINHIADTDQQEYDLYASAAWEYAKKFISNPALKAQYFKLFS